MLLRLLLLSAINIPVAQAAGTVVTLDTLNRVHKLQGVDVVANLANEDVGSAVPVQRLRHEEMRRENVVDVTDALNRFSGITLRDYGGAGGMKTVSVRGLGASHTAVSYDGVQMSDVQTGQIDFSRFSFNSLQEIAVVVGDNFNLLQPARSSAAAANVEAKTDLQQGWKAHFDQGSWERYNMMLGWRKSFGQRLLLGTNADWLFSGNNYKYTLRNGLLSTRETRTNSRMNRIMGEINAAYAFGKENVADAKIYYYDNNHHLPGIVAFYNPYNAEVLHERNLFGQARWRRSWSEQWTLQLLGKINWMESRYRNPNDIYPGGVLHENYWQREDYLSGVLRFQPFPQCGFAYAADYFYTNLNSNQNLNEKASRHSLLQTLTANAYAGPVQLSGRLLLSAYFNHADGAEASRDFCRLSPSLAATWRILPRQELYVRAFYKDIFRIPTFTESYFYHLGNPDLSPERTHQIGTGVSFCKRPNSWWTETKISLDGFFNHINDKIVSIPISLHTWRTLNIEQVRIQGLDLTMDDCFRLAPEHSLFLHINYTFQNVVDCTLKGSQTYDKQLAYTPHHSGSASLAWENDWLNISVSATGASERWGTHEHSAATHLPGYMEWRTSVWRNILLGNVKMELSASMQNILDKQYDIVNGYPMPGRSYRISATINF